MYFMAIKMIKYSTGRVQTYRLAAPSPCICLTRLTIVCWHIVMHFSQRYVISEKERKFFIT